MYFVNHKRKWELVYGMGVELGIWDGRRGTVTCTRKWYITVGSHVHYVVRGRSELVGEGVNSGGAGHGHVEVARVEEEHVEVGGKRNLDGMDEIGM